MSQPSVMKREKRSSIFQNSVQLYDLRKKVVHLCNGLDLCDDSEKRDEIYKELTKYILPQATPLSSTQSSSLCSSRQHSRLHLSENTNFNDENENPGLHFVLLWLVKILPDCVRALKDIQRQSLSFVVLDFLLHLFTNRKALKIGLSDLHPIVKSLFSAFRILLNSTFTRIKGQTVKVLLRMLQTSVAIDLDKNEEKESEMKMTVPELLLNADLDQLLHNCLNTSEKSMFNDVILFFTIFIDIGNGVLSKDRILSVLHKSLHVTHLTICEEDLDRDGYFKFIRTACTVLKEVPYTIQMRILNLFESLLKDLKELTPEAVTHFGEFMTYCTDSKTKCAVLEVYRSLMTESRLNVLAKLLKNHNLEVVLGSYMLDEVKFLRLLSTIFELKQPRVSLESCYDAYDIVNSFQRLIENGDVYLVYTRNDKVRWSLSSFVSIYRRSNDCLDMVKFMIYLLKEDFISPFVKVSEFDCSLEPNILCDTLNAIEFSLQNFILKTKSQNSATEHLLWDALLELHYYATRRSEKIVRENGAQNSVRCEVDDVLREHLFKFSTRAFWRCYMANHPETADLAPTKCFLYLDIETQELGKKLSLSGMSYTMSLRHQQDVFRLLSEISQWLEATVSWRKDIPEAQKLIVNQILNRMDIIGSGGDHVEGWNEQ